MSRGSGDDPIRLSLSEYARRLRAGEWSIAEVVDLALERIHRRNPTLQAFVHVADEQARATARKLDAQLGAGVDLGPLMGVPVGVKDLIAVDGMPLEAGTRLAVADLVGGEGDLVGALRAAGCIVLGKTRTVELALGGHNLSHPVPWNPVDPAVRRTPGGSSHGSAVAVSAGLCPLAVGSDTGGSVRVPAALCGIVGFKPSHGRWPLSGVLPLSPGLDSLGILTASVEDAGIAYRTISACLGRSVAAGKTAEGVSGVSGLRLGVHGPEHGPHDPEVVRGFRDAVARLSSQGAIIRPVDWPDAEEAGVIQDVFATLVPLDLIGALGKHRLAAGFDTLDPVSRHRLQGADRSRSHERPALRTRCRELAELARERMRDLDAVLKPTSPVLPVPVESLTGVEETVAFVRHSLANSRSGNVYDQCAVSLPLRAPGSDLPLGLEIACPAGGEAGLFDLAGRIAAVLEPLAYPGAAARRHWA